MRILAIETSCDETSAAVVENGQRLLSLVVNSQIDLHRAYGGVVPEVAARSHVEVIIPVIDQALVEAQCGWHQIEAIAVTKGPGLAGSLLIGTLAARTLAWAKQKPLIAVHHILGHVYANWITTASAQLAVSNLQLPKKSPEFPCLALIVSGGHSQLMYATNHNNWTVVGRTQDDAVGEAFDKAAKVLGLPYPGGPSIAKAASSGNPDQYQLPIPKTAGPYDFSFSGLKTAFLRSVQKECGVGHDFPSFELSKGLSEAQRSNFAASFQHIAIKYLVQQTKKAVKELQPQSLIIGGGVAANKGLRIALTDQLLIKIDYAPPLLCTDNAAMIGARAYQQALQKVFSDPDQLEIKPSWPL